MLLFKFQSLYPCLLYTKYTLCLMWQENLLAFSHSFYQWKDFVLKNLLKLKREAWGYVRMSILTSAFFHPELMFRFTFPAVDFPNRFCREWENNPCTCRMKEMGWGKIREEVSSFCGQKRWTMWERDKHYIHFPLGCRNEQQSRYGNDLCTLINQSVKPLTFYTAY